MRSFAVALLICGAGTEALNAQAKGAAAAKDVVAPPTRLWAAQTEPGRITLSWSSPLMTSSGINYVVYCFAEGSEQRLGEVSAPVQGGRKTLADVQTLTYVVVVRGRGETPHACRLETARPKGPVLASARFNEVTPARERPARPPAPQMVTATETTSGIITVTWPEVPGATAYQIMRSVAPDGFRILCSLCPATTTFVDRDAKAGARHRYTVAAISPGGVSERARSEDVTPGDVKPGGDAEGSAGTGALAQPRDATAMSGRDMSVTVTWQPVPRATGYEVSRSVNAGAYQVVARVTASVSAEARGLTAVIGLVDTLSGVDCKSCRVRYQVRAVQGSGASEAARTNELSVAPKSN